MKGLYGLPCLRPPQAIVCGENIWKRTITNGGLGHRHASPGRRFHLNSREGGYGLDEPSPADGHEAYGWLCATMFFFFSIVMTLGFVFCMRRLDKGIPQVVVISWVRFWHDRHGQLWGDQRDPGDVPRTRHPSSLSRPTATDPTMLALQHCWPNLRTYAPNVLVELILARCIVTSRASVIFFSVMLVCDRPQFPSARSAGDRQRHQTMAGNPGS